MRCSYLLLLAVSFAPCARAQNAALLDELTPLFPDSDPTTGTQRYSGQTPRGVPAAAHVLVTGLNPDAPLRCSLSLDDNAQTDAVMYQLIDVPVEQNTGLTGRTEAWDQKVNPHVVRRAPFRVFEVLEPLSADARADTDGVAALRVELPIAPDAEPGPRTYSLTLESGDWRQTLHWDLEVFPVTVPATGPQSRGYTNWFNPDIIAQRHKLERWSDPYWDMLGKYADLMARGRQNTFWLRWGDFTDRASNGDVTLNRERLQQYVRLFLERGFTRVEGGHLAGRHDGDWSSPRLDINLTGSDVTSEQGRAELAAFLGALREAIAELKLPADVQYLQHLTDEPTDTNAESYRALADQVRIHLPGVRIFEATMSQKLVGAVDAWCPQVQEYQRHREFFDARKQAGDTVWVYTCLIPGGPWLNRLLDQERLRPVYIGWALAKYDLAGFLHWGLNHYRSGVDPFQQSVVPHGEGPPNFLPAGDSHVVYPGESGPLSGLRFEAHRIGMEDCELLQVLHARDPGKTDSLIQQVFRAFDDFETDVAAYRAARRKLLEALAKPLQPGEPIALFNGRDLDHWTPFFPDGAAPEGVWEVRDGILICTGEPTGYLRTTANYTNYVLTLEWRWSPETKQAGNSGVLLRVIGEEKVWPRCVEAQLQADNAGDFWNIGGYPMQSDPARTRGANTKKSEPAENPVGAWNRYEITVNADRIILRVNGKLVNEAWQVLEMPGKIALQSEGTEIQFRNIQLVPLK